MEGAVRILRALGTAGSGQSGVSIAGKVVVEQVRTALIALETTVCVFGEVKSLQLLPHGAPSMVRESLEACC